MSQNPRVIYHIAISDDDVGEVEGMFDETGALLGSWASNDATWRGEYFNGFLGKLNFDVLDSDDVTEDWRVALETKLKARWL